MNFDWEIVRMAVPLLAQGMVVTIEISLFAALFGTLLGLVLGLCSLSQLLPLRIAVRIYVDFVRGTPLLIQIFLVFFALPVLGLRLHEVTAGIVALSLNAAGYIAEIVRGGVNSIERGQTEAAKSIGMSNTQLLIYILLPQTYRAIVPPVTNELITLTKSSSLLSVISVYELTRAGQSIISVHFVPFEIYALLALYYYALISAMSFASRWLERRLPAW